MSSIQIDCNSEEIWNALNGEGHLLRFNPYISQHEHSCTWTKPGEHDICTYGSGIKLKRTLVEFRKKSILKFQLDTGKSKMRNWSLFEIKADPNATYFRVSYISRAYENVPRPIFPIFLRLILLPKYKKYLAHVCLGMRHYIQTGSSVKRNQFGSIKYFS
jgi:hypothetical protein